MLNQQSGRIGELLVGQFTGVIDFEGLAIGLDLSYRVLLGIGGGEEGGMEAFPEGHDLGIGVGGAAAAAPGDFILMQDQAVGRQHSLQHFQREILWSREDGGGARDDGDHLAARRWVDRGEEGFQIEIMLTLELADLLGRFDGSPAGDEQLAEGIVFDDVACFQMIVRALGDEVEADDTLAAALAALASGFLEGQVEAGEGVEIALFPGLPFGRRQRPFGGEVVHSRQFLLPQFALGLELGGDHVPIVGVGGGGA